MILASIWRDYQHQWTTKHFKNGVEVPRSLSDRPVMVLMTMMSSVRGCPCIRRWLSRLRTKTGEHLVGKGANFFCADWRVEDHWRSSHLGFPKKNLVKVSPGFVKLERCRKNGVLQEKIGWKSMFFHIKYQVFLCFPTDLPSYSEILGSFPWHL